MGLAQEVGQNYNALVNSGNVRYRRWPAAAAAGAQATSGGANTMGAWKEVVAAATITDPSWLFGIEAYGYTDPATGGCIVDIGTGAGGAEVSLSNASGLCTFTIVQTTAVGEYAHGLGRLPFPIRLAGQPRLAAAIAQLAAGAGALKANIAVYCAIAVGT